MPNDVRWKSGAGVGNGLHRPKLAYAFADCSSAGQCRYPLSSSLEHRTGSEAASPNCNDDVLKTLATGKLNWSEPAIRYCLAYDKRGFL
jgi:hypothetical protein